MTQHAQSSLFGGTQERKGARHSRCICYHSPNLRWTFQPNIIGKGSTLTRFMPPHLYISVASNRALDVDGSAVTARRWQSLAGAGGDDDYFSTDFTDNQLKVHFMCKAISVYDHHLCCIVNIFENAHVDVFFVFRQGVLLFLGFQLYCCYLVPMNMCPL